MFGWIFSQSSSRDFGPISDGQKWTNQRWAKMDQSETREFRPISDEPSIFLKKMDRFQNYFEMKRFSVLKKVF
jgi:hypothetical protein